MGAHSMRRGVLVSVFLPHAQQAGFEDTWGRNDLGCALTFCCKHHGPVPVVDQPSIWRACVSFPNNLRNCMSAFESLREWPLYSVAFGSSSVLLAINSCSYR